MGWVEGSQGGGEGRSCGLSRSPGNQGLPSHLRLPFNLFGEVGQNQNRRVAAWTIGWITQQSLGRTTSGVESVLSTHCVLLCGHFPLQCQHVKSGGGQKFVRFAIGSLFGFQQSALARECLVLSVEKTTLKIGFEEK